MESLEFYYEMLNQLEPAEITTALAALGIGGIGVIVTVLSYIIANLGNAVLFSIAPALWLVVKKMKESNSHGDSSGEFRDLKGSSMKILYESDTIFYLDYMDECEKLGIGPRVLKK